MNDPASALTVIVTLSPECRPLVSPTVAASGRGAGLKVVDVVEPPVVLPPVPELPAPPAEVLSAVWFVVLSPLPLDDAAAAIATRAISTTTTAASLRDGDQPFHTWRNYETARSGFGSWRPCSP